MNINKTRYRFTREHYCFFVVVRYFDKVLRNALLMKLLDKNVPISFVMLLKNWCNRLCCAVRWNSAYMRNVQVFVFC